MTKELAHSDEMRAYFKDLADKNDACYEIAEKARSLGRDPETRVEIPRADDLASRVEKLLHEYGVEGVAEDIRRISEREGNREIVALMVAKEMAKRPTETLEKALDRAVRVGLAVITEGILIAPLEGIADTKIKKNDDGSTYVDLILAGPIRASGGTAQAMSVLLADVVRRELGIGKYIPTEDEIARFHEEIPLYKQVQHLQFMPSRDEIDLIVRNCPVCIDGEGTETEEVAGYKNLPRIDTNKVRGGACLVVAEGMCQKASKLKKHVDALKIDGWEFIGRYLDAHKTVSDTSKTVQPSSKFREDMLAGRPVMGDPSKAGGFRLRYGRGRTCGLASLAFSPASMYAMDEFMALGTQIKTERPGKACVVTPCDVLEGPILLLKNGDLIQCGAPEDVVAVKSGIAEVIDNGEILVPYGEFKENNKNLVPCGYPIEWHKLELAKAGSLPEDWEDPTYERAKEMSLATGVALHPKYNLFWSDISVERLERLRAHIAENGSLEGGSLSVPVEPGTKRTLEELGALHRVSGGRARIDKRYSLPMMECLGLGAEGGAIVARRALEGDDSLAAVSAAAGFKVMQRAGTRVGTRMGRPEKAKERDMSPKRHVMFPVGHEHMASKDIDSAVKASKNANSLLNADVEHSLTVEAGKRMCRRCNAVTFRTWCRACGSHTEAMADSGGFAQTMEINIIREYGDALKNLGLAEGGSAKCVESLESKTKTPEALEKGILRVKHGVSVYKDGTVRYDMTDIPLTHFRPREIGLTAEAARALGYARDWNGDPLERDDQLCELKVQDVIPSKGCGDFMVKVAKFVDEELERFYGLESYYRVEKRSELIGHLVFGLAPHTSGGILCRIIGYSDVRGCYGHPFFHAAKRRNCDGDEDCVILALDGLLNFSKVFLPNRRGGMMDAPLVLTTRLDPNEVDKEAQAVDCMREYPLELYYAAMDMRHPKDIEPLMDSISNRIGTPEQYERIGFTHDTADISKGPKTTAYVTMESMADKLEAQISLVARLRAVDARSVVDGVINKHFMPDMAGNLKKFATQKVRCAKCNKTFRRVPLSGKCACGSPLILTVHEASVKKYLELSKEYSERYDLDQYVRERIEILELGMKSVFSNDKVKKCKLSDFY
jgi:DNA polymerase II large subunit